MANESYINVRLLPSYSQQSKSDMMNNKSYGYDYVLRQSLTLYVRLEMKLVLLSKT